MPDASPSSATADLLFPSQSDAVSLSYSQLRATLKRSTLSIHNRLASIRADAAFVSQVRACFPRRPLVANERCGSWYIRPDENDASAYFKSTDGHERNWKFSTRRLNFHLFDLIEKNDGSVMSFLSLHVCETGVLYYMALTGTCRVIIVDSTRRGKRMPDALSTTIPIWCATLNRFLLPNNPLSSELHLPPQIPTQTHAAILALIPEFVTSLRSLQIPVPTSLTKPLRPYWITQDSAILPAEQTVQDCGIGGGDIFEDYRPVVCCTASRRVLAGTEADEAGYIQGAGDDTENWAHGLTPTVFWAHADTLLQAAEVELPEMIRSLVEQDQESRQAERKPRRRVAPRISVTSLPLDDDTASSECHIAVLPNVTPRDGWRVSKHRIEVGLGKSKTASRNLRLAISDICEFAYQFLSSHAEGKVVVACESGKDLSVGAALGLYCYLFDEEDEMRMPDTNTAFTKTLVKTRLGSMMTAFPEANPSRATLQAVNSFLMDGTR